MAGFTKLFSSIVTSSVWVKSHVTLRVWIAMLATSDREGRVDGSVPGFANLCRVSTEELEAALEELMAPDPYSRTPANEGRRIVAVSGGWQIVNYWKHREDMGNGGDGAGSNNAELNKPGKVYFARCGQAIKIGFSQNPWARVAALKTGMPTNPELLGYFAGTIQDERALQDEFKGDRLNREWFKATPRLLSVIATKTNGSLDGSDRSATTENLPQLQQEAEAEAEAERTTETPLPPKGVADVFAHWQAVMDHATAKLTPGRRKCIDGRLREGYTPDQLKQAVDGCKSSAYHQGTNDRQAVYDDLTLICRNGEKVEQFLGYLRKPSTALAKVGATRGGGGSPRAETNRGAVHAFVADQRKVSAR